MRESRASAPASNAHTSSLVKQLHTQELGAEQQGHHTHPWQTRQGEPSPTPRRAHTALSVGLTAITGGAMLGILVPSRGRPGNLQRLIEAIAKTAVDEYRIYTRIDDDDPTRDEYLALEGVIITLGPRVFYGASLNEIWPLADADGCTHLAMFGDDVVPETVGWDKMLIDALGDRLGIVYGSDGLEHLHGPDLPTHYITQTEVPRRLGWFAPPTMQHLFLDNVAREIGVGLGRFLYVPSARISHNHPWAGLSADDKTYQEGGRNKTVRAHDKAAFDAWVRDGKAADIAKLLAP